MDINFLSKLNIFKKKYRYYISICCIQKDENEYLPEWIDYHLQIGVEHFYIYDNGSKTSCKVQLIDLINAGKVTVIDYQGAGVQNEAYMDCISKFGSENKWIAFIDVDEFIVPKSTMGNLKLFLMDYENYGGLGMNWLIFGSSGIKTKTKKSQLESFIMRSDEKFGVNMHIKSIIQPKYFKKIINPHCFTYKKQRFCVNENFEKIEDAFSKHSSKKIQLNHYYCRSQEEYLDKINRGYADHIGERSLDQFYAHDRDANVIKDTTIIEIANVLKKR